MTRAYLVAISYQGRFGRLAEHTSLKAADNPDQLKEKFLHAYEGMNLPDLAVNVTPLADMTLLDDRCQAYRLTDLIKTEIGA